MMNIIITEKEQLQELLTKTVAEAVKRELNPLLSSINTKPVYTIQEVCNLFKVSKRQLQYLRDSRQLSFIQNGRKVLFRWEDLDAFFNQNYVKGGRL
jgi:excisionase family DNA binding protein